MTFISREKLGNCESCEEAVYNNELYVEDKESVYHYSCYNHTKAVDSIE